MDNSKLCIVVGVVIIVVVIAWFLWVRKDKKEHKKGATTQKVEGYSNIGDLDNLGSLDGSYDMIQAPEEAAPSSYFADMIDEGDLSQVVDQANTNRGKTNPIQRLNELTSKNLLPRNSASATPFNVDISQPTAWAFAAGPPRVYLKNRLNIQADPYRGDIPIKYDPSICLSDKSVNGRDSWRGDGYFSPYFQDLYENQLGRGYKNMPLKVAIGETIMDY